MTWPGTQYIWWCSLTIKQRRNPFISQQGQASAVKRSCYLSDSFICDTHTHSPTQTPYFQIKVRLLGWWKNGTLSLQSAFSCFTSPFFQLCHPPPETHSLPELPIKTVVMEIAAPLTTTNIISCRANLGGGGSGWGYFWLEGNILSFGLIQACSDRTAPTGPHSLVWGQWEGDNGGVGVLWWTQGPHIFKTWYVYIL